MKAIFCTIILLSLFSCQNWERYSIANVAKRTEFQFKPKEKDTYLLKINVEGEIDGKAKIVIIQTPEESAVPFEIILHKGSINSTYNLDWYQNTGKLIYIPENCTQGFINISLKFAD